MNFYRFALTHNRVRSRYLRTGVYSGAKWFGVSSTRRADSAVVTDWYHASRQKICAMDAVVPLCDPVIPDQAARHSVSRVLCLPSVLNQGWLTDAGQSAWSLWVTCPRRLSRPLNHRPWLYPFPRLARPCSWSTVSSPPVRTGRIAKVPHPALPSFAYEE